MQNVSVAVKLQKTRKSFFVDKPKNTVFIVKAKQ